MRKEFEYKLLNISEVEEYNKQLPPKAQYITWLDLLNQRGRDGWEFTGCRPTERSFLLKREKIP